MNFILDRPSSAFGRGEISQDAFLWPSYSSAVGEGPAHRSFGCRRIRCLPITAQCLPPNRSKLPLQTRQKVSSAFDRASIQISKWPQTGGLRSVCSAVDPSLSDAELRVAGECRLIVCYQGDHGKDRGLIVREISGQETERV